MLDLAWSEVAMIVIIAVLVLGPKELPKAMRTVAQFTRKARKLAGEFQGHWNEMVREAELEDVKNTVTSVTNKISTTAVTGEVEKLIDPSGEFGRELAETRTQIETSTQAATTPAITAAAPEAIAAPAEEPPKSQAAV